MVASYLPQAGPFTLVDVGAGVGLVGEALAQEFPHAAYRFIEPIDFLERRLEEMHGHASNLRDADAFPGDVVVLLDVLEHQADDREFMVELVGKMDPGAVLVVTVPALQRLWSEWDVALGHYRRYDKALVMACIQGLGVELLELSYLFPEMLPPALVRARRRRGQDPGGEAEFPDLSPPVNAALYRAGLLSLRLRRRWPAGTSLLAVMRRTPIS